MAPNEVVGNYSFTLKDMKGAETGLKFFKTDLPSSTVQVTGVKAWGDKGKPEPMHGGGHQVTWSPISMTRYLDESTALYDWYKDVCDQGAIDTTKQEPKIICMHNDAELFMWTLKEAVPTGYSQNGADAHSSDLLTETVTFTYTSAEMSR